MTHREVTYEEFYAVVGPQDVHPDIQGNDYPYVAVFKTRHREEVGRIDEQGRYLLVEKVREYGGESGE